MKTTKRLWLTKPADFVEVVESKHSYVLKFGAQARGTNQREPRSGTIGAILRCLERLLGVISCLS